MNQITARDSSLKVQIVPKKLQLQQLLPHCIPKFYNFKGFFIANAC